MADDLATKLQHWEKMSELQIKLIETLGKHKLDVAKADLVSAEAAQEWAVACKDVPDTVENVLMLIEWMRANKYMPRIGSRAYAQVTQGFSTIAGVADEQITAINKVISDIENGTYKTWNPLVLAALPESVDVKKIISSGV